MKSYRCVRVPIVLLEIIMILLMGGCSSGDENTSQTGDQEQESSDVESDSTSDPCNPNPCTDEHKTVCVPDQADSTAYTCVCDEGYVLDENTVSCILSSNDPCDPNPCTDANKTVCTQDTEDEAGYICTCDEGYHLGNDGTTCTDDPCDPNPCTEIEGRDACSIDGDDVQCDCNQYYEDDGQGGCTMITVAVSTGVPGSQNVDFSNPNSTYEATVRLIDLGGNPIAWAAVKTDAASYISNEDGIAVISDQPLFKENIVTIEVSGYARTTKNINFMSAGQKVLNITMLPILTTRHFESTASQALDLDSARLSMPGRALVKENGQFYSGEVVLETTIIDPETDSLDLAPGEMTAQQDNGENVGLESGGMMFIKATTENGEPLQLQENQYAQVGFRVPEGFSSVGTGKRDETSCPEIGQEYPLWYFDHELNAWVEEGSCIVREVEASRRRDVGCNRECVGKVRHFSWWNLDVGVDIWCVHVIINIEKPAFVTVKNFSFRQGTRWLKARYLPQTNSSGEFCSTYRVTATQNGKIDIHLRWDIVSYDIPLTVMYKFSAILRDQDKFYAWIVGDSEDLCHNKIPGNPCRTLTLNVPASTFTDYHYSDNDQDGFLTPRFDVPYDFNWIAFGLDCDDTDPNVFPGAEEIDCNGKDDNCDYQQKEGQNWTWETFPGNSPNGWNHACDSLPCAVYVDEIPGNDYDEDCNGIVSDQDNDGWTIFGDISLGEDKQYDCDDNNPDVHPDAEETGSNEIDENCDGLPLDFDGDGYLTPLQCQAITPRPDEEFCKDCDDSDANVNPDSTLDESAVAQFYITGDDNKVHRLSGFCDRFRSERLAETAASLFRDYNCDGRFSDLDGDGWCAIGDLACGEEYAWDCNDLDPRIHPLEVSSNPYVAPPCVEAEEGVNDSECEVDLSILGYDESGLNCTMAPDGSRLYCVDLVDQYMDPWGIYVCSPNDFRLFPYPLKPYSFREAWGPCDFGENLPSCETGTHCGGPMTYNETYKAELFALGYDVYNSQYPGMCFPLCGNKCTINPCTDENKNVCRMVGRLPECSCNPGYSEQSDGSCLAK